jgi:hypothetical protein
MIPPSPTAKNLEPLCLIEFKEDAVPETREVQVEPSGDVKIVPAVPTLTNKLLAYTISFRV